MFKKINVILNHKRIQPNFQSCRHHNLSPNILLIYNAQHRACSIACGKGGGSSKISEAEEQVTCKGSGWRNMFVVKGNGSSNPDPNRNSSSDFEWSLWAWQQADYVDLGSFRKGKAIWYVVLAHVNHKH